MPFVPQVKPHPLPRVGTSIERAVMDWKVKPSLKSFEKAKDVVAFANHLGGTLIIGAHEVDGVLETYVGLSERDAADVRDRYSKAVADLCQPRPIIDFEQYEHPTDSAKKIVVVNVWPSLNLVGVKVLAHKNDDGYGGVSYVYPVRVGTDATYLEPNQLAMYMTPSVRRVAVMLSKIPKGTAVEIRQMIVTSITGVGSGRGSHDYVGVLETVLEEDNIAKFRGESGQELRRIPLDCITTVFEDWDSNKKKYLWRVIVDLDR